MTCLEAALFYSKQQWRVFPVHTPTKNGCSCGKNCGTIGKHPRFNKVDLPNGLSNATTDTTIIKRWWERWPAANVAILAGEGSFDALDIDIGNGIDGNETLQDLERIHSPIPNTLEQITGSGGRQILFMANGTIKNAVKFAPGLDIRTDGGYIVAPPSLHKSGRRYEWELSSLPGEVPLAAWPSWLLKIIQDARGGNGGNPEGWETPLLKGVEEGQRDATAARLTGLYLQRGLKPIEVYFLLCGWDGQNNPPLGKAIIRRKVASIIQIRERNQTGDQNGRERKTIKLSIG